MRKPPSAKEMKETKVVTGLDNTHYQEIRRMIEAGLPLPESFYNESFVGPGGEQRPTRVNRASFSVFQGS